MSERDRLLEAFHDIPTTLVVDNRTSEPRDALMSERTTLSWVRFAATLAVSAIAIILNYRFDTSDDDSGDNAGFIKSRAYMLTVGIILAILALSSLIVAGYNYFETIRHCASEKIVIFNPKPTYILFSCIVVVILVVNITLIVDQI